MENFKYLKKIKNDVLSFDEITFTFHFVKHNCSFEDVKDELDHVTDPYELIHAYGFIANQHGGTIVIDTYEGKKMYQSYESLLLKDLLLYLEKRIREMFDESQIVYKH